MTTTFTTIIILTVLVAVFAEFCYFRPKRQSARLDKITSKLKKRCEKFYKAVPQYAIEKGLVTAVTDETVKNIPILLNILKKLGCSLPVFVFYNYLESDNMDTLKKTSGSTFLEFECCDELLPVYAILFSPCRQTVYITSEYVPLVNPEFLLSTSEYLGTGCLFFKDKKIPKVYTDRYIFDTIRRIVPFQSRPDNSILNKECGSFQSNDIIVINKAIRTKTLEKVWILSKWYSELGIPAKEFWWIASEMAIEPCAFSSTQPGLITEQSKETGYTVYFDKDSNLLGWVGGLNEPGIDLTQIIIPVENSTWSRYLNKWALKGNVTQLSNAYKSQINDYFKIAHLVSFG